MGRISEVRESIKPFETTSWSRDFKAYFLRRFNRLYRKYCDLNNTEENKTTITKTIHEVMSKNVGTDITSIHEDGLK